MTVREGVQVDPEVAEMEARLSTCNHQTADSVVEAVTLVYTIYSQELWRNHRVLTPKGWRPRFRGFWNDYFPTLLAERLKYFPYPSMGWWKNTLRHLRTFLPLGYSIREVMAVSSTLRLRLERILRLEWGSRRLLGLQPWVNRDALPVIVGEEHPDDYQLALAIIDQVFRGESPTQTGLWLEDLQGRSQVTFVRFRGVVYARIWSPLPHEEALRDVRLFDWNPDWPAEVATQLSKRLNIKKLATVERQREQLSAMAAAQ